MAHRKHYVEFFSPGTLMSETSTRPVGAWDTADAVAIAREIQERYGATPYGFRFTTCLVADPIPDGEGGKLTVTPKQVDKSGMYYIGGEILRYDDIPTTPDNHILLGNMRCNGEPLVIENRNSWRFTGYFEEDAAIVDSDGVITRRGTDVDLAEYRAAKLAEWQAERVPA